jgi:hypothetical protein
MPCTVLVFIVLSTCRVVSVTATASVGRYHAAAAALAPVYMFCVVPLPVCLCFGETLVQRLPGWGFSFMPARTRVWTLQGDGLSNSVSLGLTHAVQAAEFNGASCVLQLLCGARLPCFF